MQKKSIIEIALVAVLLLSLGVNAALLWPKPEALPGRLVLDGYNPRQSEALLNAALEARKEQLKAALNTEFEALAQARNTLRNEQKAATELLRTRPLDTKALQTRLDAMRDAQCALAGASSRATYATLTQLGPSEMAQAVMKPRREKRPRPPAPDEQGEGDAAGEGAAK